MNRNSLWKFSGTQSAQFAVVLLFAGLVKFYYSTASVNDLRWILTPTTILVEFITGKQFYFESYTGYMSSDHTFVIAASCAGVNFLITAFLMLSLRWVWRDRKGTSSWSSLINVAATAYLVTVIANTLRISLALVLLNRPLAVGLNANQLHRFEGVFVYFAVLLLLFLINEKLSNGGEKAKNEVANHWGWLRRLLVPLLIYYAVTLIIPLLNGAYHQGSFVEHAVFVFVIPVLLIMPLALLQVIRSACAARVGVSLGRKPWVDIANTQRARDCGR